MWAWLAIVIALAFPASAEAADRAANRFAQPVRAGDLVGRKLIGPHESQPLLGHVEGVETREGALTLRIRTWSVLPWARRSVEVPVGTVALLGEHVALLDLTPAQLRALPEAPPASPVSADEQLRIGLARPFH